jgi:hypothetical protein
VDHRTPVGELDDGRVAADVLEGNVDVRVVSANVDLQQLDVLHQRQCLGDRPVRTARSLVFHKTRVHVSNRLAREARPSG